MAPLNQELRTLLVDRVYRNYRVFRMSVKALRIVTDLFTSYVEFPQQLPPGVLQADLGPHRSVCNYLAGMTDREALEEHRRLFDPREST
jgi:dGTPase